MKFDETVNGLSNLMNHKKHTDFKNEIALTKICIFCKPVHLNVLA